MSPPTTAPATILRLSIPLVALVAAMGPLRAQDLEVEAPAVILKDIPFSITVRTPQSLDTVRVILRAADGRVLGESHVPPVGEGTFQDVVIGARHSSPSRLPSSRVKSSAASSQGFGSAASSSRGTIPSLRY